VAAQTAARPGLGPAAPRPARMAGPARPGRRHWHRCRGRGPGPARARAGGPVSKSELRVRSRPPTVMMARPGGRGPAPNLNHWHRTAAAGPGPLTGVPRAPPALRLAAATLQLNSESDAAAVAAPPPPRRCLQSHGRLTRKRGPLPEPGPSFAAAGGGSGRPPGTWRLSSLPLSECPPAGQCHSS
jgi:hypothetical protein